MSQSSIMKGAETKHFPLSTTERLVKLCLSIVKNQNSLLKPACLLNQIKSKSNEVSNIIHLDLMDLICISLQKLGAI